MCHEASFTVPPELFNSHPLASDPFPKLLHQTWKSSSLPTDFQISHQRCIAMNADFRHILWTDDMNRQFVKDNYPWFLRTYDAYNSNIKRADAIRYFYMYHFGGVYADLDVKCIRGFDALATLSSISDVVLGRKGSMASKQSIPNVILVSKPSSIFWLHVIQNMARRVNCGTPMYDTGPELLYTTYIKRSTESVVLLPSDSFYPLDWETNQVRRVPHANRERHWRHHTFSKYSIAFTFWRHSWN